MVELTARAALEDKTVGIEDIVTIAPCEEEVKVEVLPSKIVAETASVQRLSATDDCAVVVGDYAITIDIHILCVTRFDLVTSVLLHEGDAVAKLTCLVEILILVGALFAPFLTYPQYIIVTDEGIGIHTLARTRLIPYSNIETIERLDKSCIQGGTIRLFGIGGMLGNIGWFRNSQLGTFRAYITDSNKVFLIRLKQGKPIAISVSEPDDFMPFYLKGGNHVYSSK